MNRSESTPATSRVPTLLAALALFIASALNTSAAQDRPTPLTMVLVEPGAISETAIDAWKKEHFNAVVVLLDEAAPAIMKGGAFQRVQQAGLELYYWIEVGRNPELAALHPEWMAALGMHTDWQKNFPNAKPPGAGEVAKAYPWVPIAYRGAFDAQLSRIEGLLHAVPAGWRGVFLNDLQGGPSSCGCGNLQCRWAIDYRVPSTAAVVPIPDEAPARFIDKVRERTGAQVVIPVWTTECEKVDLPLSDKDGYEHSTGFCGNVKCAVTTCPVAFARQWFPVTSNHGPVALLTIHSAFQRDSSWVTNALSYLDQTVSGQNGKPIARDGLWVVVEDDARAREAAARPQAERAGIGAIIVTRTKIEQSYEPRIIKVPLP